MKIIKINDQRYYIFFFAHHMYHSYDVLKNKLTKKLKKIEPLTIKKKLLVLTLMNLKFFF